MFMPLFAPLCSLPRTRTPLALWAMPLVFLMVATTSSPSAHANTALMAPFSATQTAPEAATSASNPPLRPRVGLVLSGGGARGFAHVGVLKALEAARVPVDLVVGTSMGAIVGGLYASGMSPATLERELMTLDWDALLNDRTDRQTLSQRRKEEDFQLSPVLQLGFRDGEFRLPSGAVSTRSLEWLLRRYTLPTRGLSNFDALPTPFRAVATDMETGQAVVMDRGDLAAALRASMSVPGVFGPLELDGRLLGDGGLVNNLPVDVARQMGADVVIAVNIGTPLAGRETLTSVLGVSAQMINILTEQNVQRSVANLTRHDLLLIPPLGPIGAGDFNRAADIADLGNRYANTVKEALLRFSVGDAEYATWELARIPPTAPLPGALAFVRFEGVPQERAPQLQRLMDTAAGQPLQSLQLDTDLKRLAATGDYGQIDYRLEADPATQREGLVVALDENDWGPNYFRVGLDLRTDFSGQGEFNLRLNHNRHWLTASGTEWRNQVELGSTTGLRTEIHQPLGRERDRFISAFASTRNHRVELFDASGTAQAQVLRRDAIMGLDHGWTMGRGGRVGAARAGVFAAVRSATPELVQAGFPSLSANQRWYEAGVKGSFVADQLDHANFPQQGYQFVSELRAGQRRVLQKKGDFYRLELQGTQALTWGRHTINLYARAARVSDVPSGAVDEYSLGGFHQLSGYKVGQVAGNYLALGRVGYYHRINANPGIARALFVGGTAEVGNAWNSASAASLRDLRTGFSLYVGADTSMGPVYFSLVHAPRGQTGLYLFIGRP